MRNGSPTMIFRAMALAGLVLWGTGVAAYADGVDNFDSYADGTDLLGTGNGQFSYINTAPGGSPISGSSTLKAVTDAGAQSAPNVQEYADNADNGGSWRARLDPALAVDLSAAGSAAKIEFDFKTTSGPGNRISMTVNALYSLNASGASEDYIDTDHNAGIADGGLFFLNNGNVVGGLVNRYQANTWYHWDMTVTRPDGSCGAYDYTLEISEIGGASLDVITFEGARQAGRPFLTGVGFRTSSNPSETIQFDNLSITSFVNPPPPPLPGTLTAEDTIDTYGTAGTDILGQSNGEFSWIDGILGAETVAAAGGHVQVNDTDFQSAPNSMEFFDDTTAGQYTGRLVLPAEAHFLGINDTVRLGFDFKTTAGPGGRTSTAFRALYSANAFGGSEDWINSNHIFGIADNGNWFVQGGTVFASSYQPNTWYNLSLEISREVDGDYAHALTLNDIGTGTQLGCTLSSANLASAGRGFLTGLVIGGSSNAGETTLFDNFTIEDLTPFPGPGTLTASDNFDTYGVGGTDIFGQTNGQFTWLKGAQNAGDPGTFAIRLETNDTDVQSPPNSMQFVNNEAGGGFGAFTGQFDSTVAVEITPTQAARFATHFKTVGKQVSLSIRLLYSTDAFGLGQDYIDNGHLVAIADNGNYSTGEFGQSSYLPSTTVGGTPYAADTWYLLEIIAEGPVAGEHLIRARISNLATGAVLGELSSPVPLTDAGRNWVTGIAFYGSSNSDEITLFDNMRLDTVAIDAPPGTGACCLSSGICVVDTESGCVSQGGTYGGDGVLCSEVTCCPNPFADIDGNGIVNNDDVAVLIGCANGPEIAFEPTPEECICFDRDDDGDVDSTDFAKFQLCISGADPVDPACDD